MKKKNKWPLLNCVREFKLMMSYIIFCIFLMYSWHWLMSVFIVWLMVSSNTLMHTLKIIIIIIKLGQLMEIWLTQLKNKIIMILYILNFHRLTCRPYLWKIISFYFSFKRLITNWSHENNKILKKKNSIECKKHDMEVHKNIFEWKTNWYRRL